MEIDDKNNNIPTLKPGKNILCHFRTKYAFRFEFNVTFTSKLLDGSNQFRKKTPKVLKCQAIAKTRLKRLINVNNDQLVL